MRSIILGGIGMLPKHLLKYNIIPMQTFLTHSAIALCNINHGHHIYEKRLKTVLNDNLQKERNSNILHCMSGSCWYALPYLSKYKNHGISNLILESPVYRFNTPSLIDVIAQHSLPIKLPDIINTTLSNLADILLIKWGLTEEWKKNYIKSIENPEGITNVLLIYSKKDEIISYKDLEKLGEKLIKNGKTVEIIISEISSHNRMIIEDNELYKNGLQKWLHNIK